MNDINKEIDDKINKLLEKKTDKKTILILGGGGIKGIAHIGALQYLEEKKILENIKIFAGSSIGGILCALLVIGYTPDEIMNFINLFNINKLKSFDPENFLTNFGLDKGEKLIFILNKLFELKKINQNITFKNLYELTKKELILTGVCMNDKQVHYISHITYPNMPVILGMRISASVPLWFHPVIYEGKMFIDGGCVDNYPISYFKNKLNETLGLYLNENIEYNKNINNIETFLFELFKCFYIGLNTNLINGFEKETIIIDIMQINMMNFDLTQKNKEELFNCGYICAKKFYE